ncbi:MAG: CmcJ/NvfI family oxidoreductase [Proteobacteria bacterium]|nr:CmcJ/NvfI family oxidoreductase [Pseudomonadota bacterium]
MAPEIMAALNYLVDTSETPVFTQTATAAGTVSLSGARQPRTVTIRNARPLAESLTLDIEGFAFAEQVTQVTDFNDDAQLASVYTPEIETLVARIAGAREAIVFDHTRRSTDASHREKYGSRDPVPAPHSDYDDSSARQRMRDKFGDAADERLRGRFAIVNVWRSMSGPIEQWPLTVCDSRTIDEDFLISTRREAPIRPEPSFEYARPSATRHAAYDANHRWYYFPRMTRDEVLLFKNYDTLTDGTARYALHSAFEDPNSPPVPAARETIETRVFVFYD